MLIFAATPEEVDYLRAWAEARIPHLHGMGLPECQVAGVVRHGKLSAVVAFYDHGRHPDGDTLNVSVAAEGPHWARPSVLHAIFHYAFVHVGAYVLEVGTPLANAATIKFLLHVGFKQWGVRPHGYGRKKHQVCFTMSADAWRKTKYFKGIEA